MRNGSRITERTKAPIDRQLRESARERHQTTREVVQKWHLTGTKNGGKWCKNTLQSGTKTSFKVVQKRVFSEPQNCTSYEERKAHGQGITGKPNDVHRMSLYFTGPKNERRPQH